MTHRYSGSWFGWVAFAVTTTAAAQPVTQAGPSSTEPSPASTPTEPATLPEPSPDAKRPAEPDRDPPAPLEQHGGELEPRPRPAGTPVEPTDGDRVAHDQGRASAASGPAGFVLSSRDGAYTFSPRLLLQFDSRTFIDDNHKLVDGLLFRRLRPYIEGTVAKNVSYRVAPDFAGGNVVIYDAFVDMKADAFFRVRVGKFTPPVGLEQLQSGSALFFVERSLATNLVPNRDLGVEIHGEIPSGIFGYAVGVFNGVPDNALGDFDIDDSKEIEARLYVRPFAETDIASLKKLMVGVAGSRGEETGTAAATYLPNYKTPGQQTFFSYTADTSATAPASATTVAAGVHSRGTVHLYHAAGPLGLMGEYVVSQQRVKRNASSALLTHQARQAAVSIALTGEDASFEGVTPRKNLDVAEGHWGALEIVGRFSAIELDRDTFNDYASDAKSARSAAAFAGGLNWYINPNVKFSADYEQTQFRAGGNVFGARRDMERVLFGRTQLSF
jgi:phosphate-selective porin OprO/OprP